MPDDLTIRGPQDPKTVNTSQEHEISYWCKKWDIDEKTLEHAVSEVGNAAADVEQYLREKKLGIFSKSA